MLKKTTRFIAHALSTCAVVTACAGVATTAHALAFKQISQVYFFGDSLSDSGFNDLWPTEGAPPSTPPLPAGKAPTFTTYSGYIWSQYVARDIKGVVLPIYPSFTLLPAGPTPPDTLTNNAIYASTGIPGFVSGTLNGVNYAAAGSTTNSVGLGEPWAPSLHQQVKFYLAEKNNQADPKAVYFVWSGANDFLKALSGAGLTAAPAFPSEAQLLALANTTAMNIANQVALLSSSGAKRVVVLSLPNLALTPFVQGLAVQAHLPTLPAQIKTLTFTFNSMLNTYLGNVTKQYGTKILYIDTYSLLDNVVTATQQHKPFQVAGKSYNFTNYTQPVCGASPAVYCTSGSLNHVFADTIHPTDLTHQALATAVEQAIQNWNA